MNIKDVYKRQNLGCENMIFSNLSEKLQESLGKLTGKGKLSEKDVYKRQVFIH